MKYKCTMIDSMPWAKNTSLRKRKDAVSAYTIAGLGIAFAYSLMLLINKIKEIGYARRIKNGEISEQRIISNLLSGPIQLLEASYRTERDPDRKDYLKWVLDRYKKCKTFGQLHSLPNIEQFKSVDWAKVNSLEKAFMKAKSKGL